MKYFTIAELTASNYAEKHNIDNTPSKAVNERLVELITHALDPIRENFGKPMIVTSGYRSPRLNKAVGGSITSDHQRGCAADFTIPSVSNLEVCRWIEENLEFRQCIYEFGESGWIHIAYDRNDNKRECLSAVKVKGRTVYNRGF